MRSTLCRIRSLLIALSVCALTTPVSYGVSDFDDNGYVGLPDFHYFEICFLDSGPDHAPVFPLCVEKFDSDDDGDVDLVDYGAFQRARGHLPIPLRDRLGALLTIGSSDPMSGRQTCGTAGCHDVDRIANGMISQQGRTDVDGNIIMQDDFLGNGQWWVRSQGMYGRWSGGGGGLNRQFSGKHNVSESYMDSTSFYWVANCGGCHAGGGGAEFDRDGQRYWDETTGQFGYEALGLTAADVVLDGDYAVIDDSDGSISPARWDLTGVVEPECLHCHRADRVWIDGADMNRAWRADVLATTTELVDASGAPVQAYAAAGTAGQGWFSTLDTESSPPVLQIDYSVGVADGHLITDEGDNLYVAPHFVKQPTTDQACWGCHLPGGFQAKRGTVWFDERDVHFKKFTNRSDEDPTNDIPDNRATTCGYCHPSNSDHNFAKGDSPYARFRNELDWEDFRSCRDCHLTDSPVRHPDAPEVPGGVIVHIIGSGPGENGPFRKLSCQACHVPYALERAAIVTDRSVTGTAIQYFTDELLSADPLDPTNEDKSTWYPSLVWKTDSDGEQRLFPQKEEVAIYWADWDQNGTPEDRSDDTVYPIILWRVRQITGNAPLPGVTDDTGDGKPEVNRAAEMILYMHALKGNDSYGEQVAYRPVLVKGERVWYEDPLSIDQVSWFKHEGTGIAIESFERFGLDHNVLAKAEAWGSGGEPEGCYTCHVGDFTSPVIDRLVLVDPFDLNGNPIYKTVRQLTGIDPPPP